MAGSVPSDHHGDKVVSVALNILKSPDLMPWLLFEGPIASPLGKRFGAGLVVMLSGVMVGGALILASLFSSALPIAVVLTLFAGKCT